MEKLSILGGHSTTVKAKKEETGIEHKAAEKLPENTDRLRPRGRERGGKRSATENKSSEGKKLREGQEEMEKLKTLVPTLRMRDGRVSQMDIIEETISYIDQLHRRIAERMVGSSTEFREEIGEQGTSFRREDGEANGGMKKPIVLTLEQVQSAENMSHEIECSGTGGFAARLAELSKHGGYNKDISDEEEDIDDKHDFSTKQNSINDKSKGFVSLNPETNGQSDKGNEELYKASNEEKLTEEQELAIESVKSSFVALLSALPPDK